MNIEYFREFVTLAQVGKFQDAANMLFISQSALSKHIKNMETELGTTLFQRNTHGVELSEFGKEFLQYAVAISEIEESYLHLLGDYKTSRKQINIGYTHDCSLYIRYLSLLPDNIEDIENFNFSVVEGTADQLKEMLRLNKCQFAVVCEQIEGMPPEKDMFRRINVLNDKVVALVPPSNPLYNEKILLPEQLADEKLISLGKDSIFTQVADTVFQDAGLDCKFAYTVTRRSFMVELVENGLGIGLFSKLLSDSTTDEYVGWKAIDIHAPVAYACNIIYPIGKKLPAVTNKMIESLQLRAKDFCQSY